MLKQLIFFTLFLSSLLVYAQGAQNDTGEGVYYDLGEAKQDPSRVRVLILEHQNYKEVPTDLALFHNLEALSLKGNALSQLPDFFTELLALHDLNLSENAFVIWPSQLFKMPNIKILAIYGNQLEDIPEGIASLKNLHRLNVSFNKISTLAPALFEMTVLNTLNLNHNALSRIPEEICKLTALHYLYLGHNTFDHIPSCMVNMIELSMLDLDKTNMVTLPSHLEKMKSLRLINLRETKISKSDVEKLKKVLNHTVIDHSSLVNQK